MSRNAFNLKVALALWGAHFGSTYRSKRKVHTTVNKSQEEARRRRQISVGMIRVSA